MKWYYEAGKDEPRPRLEGKPGMLDIREPDTLVEVIVSDDRRTVWINVDGRCALRIQEIPNMHISISQKERGARRT